MEFIPQYISDVVLLVPKVFGDERGEFFESFRQDLFEKYCGNYRFVQDNHSKSRQGILRGLHYQLGQPQGKLVRVTRGKVYDVAVDMRANSPTFGQWVGITLSEDNKRILWVPPGFAHGFYAMSKKAEIFYKCTDYYSPSTEVSVRWNDPELNIQWPVMDEGKIVLSEKDADGMAFVHAPAFNTAHF